MLDINRAILKTENRRIDTSFLYFSFYVYLNMKNRFRSPDLLSILFLLTMASPIAFAQTSSPILATDTTRTISDKVKIADWYGFSKAAYSLSFDDGLISHYNYAAPILDKYNLKATFYIVSENLEADSFAQPSWRYGYWYQFIQLNNKGHELGSHSATHPKLSTLPDGGPKQIGSLQYELNAPIKALQKKIPGYKALTFAYPFVDFNAHVKEETAKLYTSSRGLGSGLNGVHPADWMNIQAHTISYNPGRTIESDQAKITEIENWISSNTIAKGGWTVYLAHDILPFIQASTATDSWQPVSSESFESFAYWLKEKQRSNELWIETVGNVTRYIKERDAVSIVLQEETPSKLLFSITDNLPDELFNYPITLEITLPESWKKVLTKQNKSSHTLSISDRKIILNATPDKGILEINKVE
jgi:peptidoglycan/xylan/chitin deacetylase (PgdA/CDA1 family)